MARQTVTLRQDSAQHAALENADERPFIVCVRPRDWPFSEYHGTRAQLEAEGVIPKDTAWPGGTQRVYWEQGLFKFELRRIRPDGMKGPMKLWRTGDYWCLRWERKLSLSYDEMAIANKAKEFAQLVHLHSPAGRREREVNWGLYWKAHEDKAFQAFKSIFVPQRRKPGRPRQANI